MGRSTKILDFEAYHKQYRKQKGGMSSDILIDRTVPTDLDGDRPICSHFGCGKTLSSIEYLAGKRCTTHMGHKENIMNVLKY